MKNYKKLELINKKTGIMESIAASLMWDKETYMPVGSISEKAEQLSLINDMVYDMFVGSDMSVLLQKSKTENLDNWQLRNHALTKKILLEKKCVDPTLLSKFTKISSLCCQKWKEARKKQDFSIVEPLLSEVINLAKEINKSKANALGIGLYDAALDSYNPQSKSVDIDNIFNELQPFLSKVISENSNKKFQYFDKSLSRSLQAKISTVLMKNLGLNLDKARLDASAHPFCIGRIEDVRLTTNYEELDFTKAIWATIHETGHGLYNQNLPEKWIYQPVGNALGYAVHESQSLFFEKQICKTKEFCKYIISVIKDICKDREDLNPDNLYYYINNIKPSLIRVYADEVTYHLHVIIRYKIEKLIFSGEITTTDIPAIWNEYYKKYLNIIPKNDSEGCMQDIHWYSGLFGYFPNYSLGAIISAQLRQKMEQDIPNISDLILKGDFVPIVCWLNKKVHSTGSFYPNADELLKKITGKKLGITDFKNYLSKKYFFV